MEFHRSQSNKHWLWLALDRNSRQVVALFVGDRTTKGALGLWQAIPERYRHSATFYTDDWKRISKSYPLTNTALGTPKETRTMGRGSFARCASGVRAWFA